MSVIHKRNPGIYCGPGILCQNSKGQELNSIPNPPAENGKWVDGFNTFIDKKQGVSHTDNFKTIFPNEAIIGDNSAATGDNSEALSCPESLNSGE